MDEGVERWPAKANPYSMVSTYASFPLNDPLPAPVKALFFSIFAPYIGAAGLPGYGNKVPPK